MKTIRIGKWTIPLPRRRAGRLLTGVLLVILGFFGFLPVLGFWMIPLGLAILSTEIPPLRRLRRRLLLWLRRRLPLCCPGLASRLGMAAREPGASPSARGHDDGAPTGKP